MTLPDASFEQQWKSLRKKYLLRSLLPTLGAVFVAPYVVGLLLDLRATELTWVLLVVLPIVFLVNAVGQQVWVAGWICRTAVAVDPTDGPYSRLERLLALPRRLELFCTTPAYSLGAFVFTLGCCLKFDKSFALLPVGLAAGLGFSLLVGIPTTLLFQSDVLPLVLDAQYRAPRGRPRPQGIAWPRQSWYLPYSFSVLLVLLVLCCGVVVGKKFTEAKDILVREVTGRADQAVVELVRIGFDRVTLDVAAPVLLICATLLGMFVVSGWLMGQRERFAAQALEKSLRSLVGGAPAMPEWLGTDEVGDVAFAVAEVSADMGKVFDQLGAMAQGNLSVELEGESGLILAFRSSQAGLRQLSDQMKVLSRGNTAADAKLVGDLGDAFGQLSVALGATIAQAKTIAKGDLRGEVKVEGELGLAINQMTSKLRGMVSQTQEVGHKIGDIVVSLRSAATQLSTATTEQVSALTETANTMTEMSQTSSVSADRCAELIRQGDSASAVVEEGRSGASEAGTAMQAISASLAKVSSVSGVLADKVQQIDGIIETVGFLADQSSTLAINAGIEASRAGDAGRGFAAVAREMRTLASDSRKATAQIREILQEIRQKTVQVDTSVAAGGSTIEEGVRLVNQLGGAIGQLGVTIHDAVGLMRQVEGSARQHQAGVAQVTQALRSMQTASESIRDGARLLSGLSEQATGLATSLKSTAGAYQLPARGEA